MIVHTTVVKQTLLRQAPGEARSLRLEACTQFLGLLEYVLCVILQRASLTTIKEWHPAIETTFVANIHVQARQEITSVDAEGMHATLLLNLLEAFLSERLLFAHVVMSFFILLPKRTINICILQLEGWLELLAHKPFLQHGHALLSQTG